jgi:alpha-tubulin suppressor-like RCC1 family protein
LGDGSINVNSPYGKLTPVSVNDLGGSITAMVAGSVYTCALTSMGGVQCWGGNGVGELGDNSTTDRLAPVWLVGFEDFNGGAGDAFPYNNAASIDTDHDGMPDNWNASCNTACQSGSGLVLDSDDDDDGIPDVIDPVLSWMPLTVNGSYRGASVAENNQRQ